jgi:hypothetical protein
VAHRISFTSSVAAALLCCAFWSQAFSQTSPPDLFSSVEGAFCSGTVKYSGGDSAGTSAFVAAHWFRKPDGTSWVDFKYSRRPFGQLPVTATSTELRFKGRGGSTYTLLGNASELSGPVTDSAGDISLTCHGKPTQSEQEAIDSGTSGNNLDRASALRQAAAPEPGRAGDWPHVSPQQDGWSEAGLAKVLEDSRRLGFSAVMIFHHGAIVSEWGDTVRATDLTSIRKSLLSALIGIAVADHKIALDSTLAQLNIDDNSPSLTDAEKQATVRMLLEARSGIYHPALYETAGMAASRPPRGSHAPNTFWYYNNWDLNTLVTIYERATGSTIFNDFDRLIAKPIQMQDYKPQDGRYVSGAASEQRAYPIRMSARDLARFALLYLEGGAWHGRQIVPADWVRESTQSYSSSGFGPGYGYLWWTGTSAEHKDKDIKLPTGSFFAWGDRGQFAFVVPSADLVVVARLDTDLDGDAPLWATSGLLHHVLQAGGFETAL